MINDSVIQVDSLQFHEILNSGSDKLIEIIRNRDKLLVSNSNNQVDEYHIISSNCLELLLNEEVEKNKLIFTEDINIENEYDLASIVCEECIFVGLFNIVNTTIIGDFLIADSYFLSNFNFNQSIAKNKFELFDCTIMRNAIFHGSTFQNYTSLTSKYCNLLDLSFTHFMSLTYFYGFDVDGKIEWNNLFFDGTIVLEYSDISNQKKQPIKLISDNEYCETIDNLHILKKIFHRNEQYEDEDTAYYWYKKYERITNKKTILNKFRAKKINIIIFLVGIIRNFFNLIILDFGTKYFTSPTRVLKLIGIIIFVNFILYLGANYYCNELLGYLVIDNTIKNEQTHKIDEGNRIIISTEMTSIPLKDKYIGVNDQMNWYGFVKDNLYFSLITFTTIGYGEIQPIGLLQLFAGIEGLIGVLIMSLLLVTSAKKVLW